MQQKASFHLVGLTGTAYLSMLPQALRDLTSAHFLQTTILGGPGIYAPVYAVCDGSDLRVIVVSGGVAFATGAFPKTALSPLVSPGGWQFAHLQWCCIEVDFSGTVHPTATRVYSPSEALVALGVSTITTATPVLGAMSATPYYMGSGPQQLFAYLRYAR